MVFFREIEDLETIKIDNTNKQLVSRFMDLKSLQVDDSAKKLREKLKEEILKKLPQSNIHKMNKVLFLAIFCSKSKNLIIELKIKWSDKDGVSKETHSDYLKEMGDLFYKNVKNLIDKNARFYGLDIANDKKKEFEAELYTEIRTHANFVIKFSKDYHGNEDTIEKVTTILFKIF